MKEYMKMADVFVGEVKHEQKTLYTLKSEGFKKGREVFVNDVCACFNGHSDAAKYAANAINSHDELVEMNNDLLAALEGVIDYLTFDGFGGRFNSLREDVDLTDGLKKFMDVIAKAKGEQQSQPNALRDDVYVAGGKE